MDNRTIAKKKFEEQRSLFDRMDIDADLVNLVSQYDRIPDVNKKKIPNSVYITLNDAAMFAWRVETSLNAVNEQIKVTSAKKGFDESYVEDFIRALFIEADKLLPMKDLFPINPFLDQQTCRRGRVADRCLCQIINGELVPDIVPFDTRYHAHWMGKKGLAGGAYKTTRTPDQILYEYPKAAIDEKKEEIEVTDIWVPDKNEVWADNVLLKEQKNPFGYVPELFRKVPMGSMLLDKDSRKFQGESIFFLIRDLLPELNRLVSIIQTFNLQALDHALQLKIPQANIDPNMPVKGHTEATAPGTVNVTPSEGGYFDMPMGQLQQQAELLHTMIQSRIDRATQSFIQSMLQPKSATEIVGITQERGDVILPRLATRGLIKQDTSVMAIKQTIESAKKNHKTTFKMGNRDDWEVSKLEGEYDIEFTYSSKDSRMDIARGSIAASQRGVIPDKAIRRDTLQREDPEKDERELRWEEAERLSPLVKMDRTIRSLLEEAKRDEPGAEREAMMLTAQMIPALKQAMAGQMTPQAEGQVKPSQPMIPLTSQGGASAKQQVQP